MAYRCYPSSFFLSLDSLRQFRIVVDKKPRIEMIKEEKEIAREASTTNDGSKSRRVRTASVSRLR